MRWLPRLRRKAPILAPRFLERFDDSSNPAYSDLADLLGESLPTERYTQRNSRHLLNTLVPDTGNPTILDIGCGRGLSRDWFLERSPGASWHGIDIVEAHRIKTRKPLRDAFQLYDGTKIPHPAGSFDFCFSHQVFEHVRHPVDLLKSIHEVLRDDGVFFGSVSGGETFHRHSLFNYTALGWKTILEDNGFELINLYAGVDALSLLLHHWTKNREEMGSYFQQSILNAQLEQEEVVTPEAIRYQNALKVAFAGHLVFEAKKV